MDSFAKLRQHAGSFLQNAQQNMPSVSIPQVSMPQVSLGRRSSPGDSNAVKGTWERIDIPPLPRSSHSLDIVSGSAYVFGGEARPTGEAADNDIHVIRLPFSSAGADYHRIKPVAAIPESQAATPPARPRDADGVPHSAPYEGAAEGESESKDKGKGKEVIVEGQVPPARVGHATAVIGSRILMFGGRGTSDTAPLDEGGRVWVFDTRTNAWTHLDPAPAVKGGSICPHPTPRSHHCAAATDRPRDFAAPPSAKTAPQNWRQWAVGDISKTGIPQDPVVGHVAETAVDEEAAGYGTFFVHGGCVTSGERTSDLWSFDVRTRTWTEMPVAPGPSRSGAAICISKSRLFRFGGFDGDREIGGQLDFLHLEVETFNDRLSKGEVAVHARGGWQTIYQDDDNASSPPTSPIPARPGQAWPAPRSGASFEALTVGGGRECLILALGESTPSKGQGGTFLSDVWTFQVPPLGMSAASLADAVLQATGRKTGDGKWSKVAMMPYDIEADDDGEPTPRGWLASAPMSDLEESAVVVWGGLGESNRRQGDGWILRLGDSI